MSVLNNNKYDAHISNNNAKSIIKRVYDADRGRHNKREVRA